MMHVNYRKWARYIHKILKQFGAIDGPILDIGCGTGRFLQELQRLKYGIQGCDPSLHMLKVARKRLEDVPFYQDQLPEMQNTTAQKFSAFTCLYDTMNYLSDEAALEASLVRTHQLLPDAGIFVFDIVTDVHCQQYFQDYQENEVLNKDYAYDRSSHYDQEKGLQYNRIRIYTPNGTYTEEHCQKIFAVEEIVSIIENSTDFHIIGQFEDFTFDAPDAMSGRIHFVLSKQ